MKKKIIKNSSIEFDLDIPKKLPVLPLKDTILFPNMIFPTLIGRTSSLLAISASVQRGNYVFVSTQKNPEDENPTFDAIYEYGTVAKVLQVLRLPNNLLKVLLEGLSLGKIKKKFRNSDFLEAEITPIAVKVLPEDLELQAFMRHTDSLFFSYVKQSNNLPGELLSAYEKIQDPLKKLYFVSGNLKTKLEHKQKLLEFESINELYFELNSILAYEIEMLKLEVEIDSRVHQSIQKTQKKYYIQEQIRLLQNELDEDEIGLSQELLAIKKAIEESAMPDKIRTKAMDEFDKLRKTPNTSADYSVNRNYLEILTQVPWNKFSKDNIDIEHVKKILDEDHYDLEKPKDRILEFIAILNLVGNVKKQILCLVGPPGVGKTSLARSIARALGREFVRFSLGGVRDEAEIRGHRRTYVGALPGKIIQSMKKAGTSNPVILLDEIDKMTTDFRGDPSSALLEVLDPEQNVAFNDHFLEVDYDLSNVFFVTTANVRYDIPLPLLDRMEIIELNSYLDPEKVEIARRHIIPKLLKDYGLSEFNIEFPDSSILKIIREYTRESGVRNVEREIASIFRKLTKDILLDNDIKKLKDKIKEAEDSEIFTGLIHNSKFIKLIKTKKYVIDEKMIENYLKAPKFKDKRDDLDDKIGVATGLAWTSVGGDTLPIEVTIMPGPEKLTLTGKLGDVMKESAMAALSFIKSNYKILKLKENFTKNKEIHIHLPEGAIPKDGPSAGIGLALSIISAATDLPLRGDLAMTGEITLRGNILAIGGLKEKLLAARRAGVKTVMVPKENSRDVEDIAEEIKSGLEIVYISHLTEALNVAFRGGFNNTPTLKVNAGK